jgi:hypothetical protein
MHVCLLIHILTPLQAGAIASFLRELVITDCPYADSIMDDLRRVLEVHFQDMASIVPARPGPTFQAVQPMTPSSPHTPHALAFCGPSPRKGGR